MAIDRRPPGLPFAQIANVALQDERLSWSARGVLAFALSHAANWEVTTRLLVASGPDGIHACKAALKELTDLGYRVVEHYRVGQSIRSEARFMHLPADHELRVDSLTVRKPDHQETCPSENLTVRESDRQETEPAIKDYPLQDCLEKDDPIQDSATVVAIERTPRKASRFEEFWAVYPRRVAKASAVKAWAKATKGTDPQDIIDGAIRLRDDPNREDQFTPHPATWLNRGSWEDDALPARVEQRKMTRTDQFMALAREFDEMEDMRWTLEM